VESAELAAGRTVAVERVESLRSGVVGEEVEAARRQREGPDVSHDGKRTVSSGVVVVLRVVEVVAADRVAVG